MNIVEIIAAALAVLYTWLELKQRNLMWVVGIVSALMYVVVMLRGHLYAYMCLYAYYVAASVYGLWQWKFGSGGEGAAELPVTHATARHAAVLLPVTAALSAALSVVLARYTDSPAPVLEAISTALSIVALWMLAKKLLEHWLVWIVADALLAVVSFMAELYPSMLLGVFYVLAAVYGYFVWRKTIFATPK